MSQGIVKVTPRPGAMGQLDVTIADPNSFGIKSGATLSFPDPEFSVRVGETVNCVFTSAKSCNVFPISVPAGV